MILKNIRIKYKLFINFCIIAAVSIGFIGVVVSWKLSESISRQSGKLVSDMRALQYEVLHGHYQMLIRDIQQDIQRSAQSLYKDPYVVKNLEYMQTSALIATLEVTAKRDEIDFAILFNANSQIQASFPSTLNAFEVEAYFKSWELGAHVHSVLSGETKDIPITTWNVMSKFSVDELKILGLDTGKVSEKGTIGINSVGIIESDSGDVIGICLVGKLLNNYDKPLKQLYEITGSASVIYLDTTPITQAGFDTTEGEQFDLSILQIDPKKHEEVYRSNDNKNMVLTFADKTYLSMCSLLKSFEGENIGSICVGVPESQIAEAPAAMLSYSLETKKSVQAWILGIGALSLSLFAIVSFVVATRIVRPVGELSDAANRIATGDLRQEIPITSTDEVGDLSKSLHKVVNSFKEITTTAKAIAHGDLSHNVTPRSEQDELGYALQDMSAYLNEMASVATAIANGDLRQEVQPKTEYDVLGQAFHRLKSLKDTITEIMQGAERLSDASAVLKQISTDMASATEQTSQQIQTISSNSQQINQTINGVSTATEELAASVREISQNVIQVVNVVVSTVKMTKQAHATITELQARSSEIGNISHIITTITQQTNLLALNATIEAARAGDFGKGFAVVASEVKDLARATAASAEDITHKIGTIQTDISKATEAMAHVSEGIQQVQELSDAIASAVEEQAATTNEISRSIADTAHGSDKISQSIGEVASATRQTSQQTVDVQEAAQELALLAVQLRELVEKFKI